MFQYFSIDRPKKKVFRPWEKINKTEITKQFSICSKFPMNVLTIFKYNTKGNYRS